jgi:hypothetical protein
MDAETTARVKQFNALAGALDAAYLTLTAVLAALPIPMLLPAKADTLSLTRAWEMTAEERMLPMTAGHVRSMITAYFTAWEIASICNIRGAAIWRLRAIEDALTRVDEHATAILRHVDGDFRAERLTDEEIAEANRIVAAHIRDKDNRKR